MKWKAWFAGIFFLLAPSVCLPYSFLTHETLIDIAWDSSIKPVLLNRYPKATPAELRVARSFAYGGATIQDAGYYPFGHALFSDLTHYVRSGDFITNLIHESRTMNELAFSLGALSHYVGDTVGHRYAVNISVPEEFPKLATKYGPVVTYEENEHAHIRTEFAFDVDQLGHARFAPLGYVRRIGFRVPVRLIDRAFYDTYGVRLHGVIGDELPAFRSYTWSVRRLLPRVAFAEVLLNRRHFPPDENDNEFHTYEDKLKETDQASDWEAYRKHKASFETRFFAVIIFILPKWGPLSDLSLRGPTVSSEQDYVKSVNMADTEFADLLSRLEDGNKQKFEVPDLDLDTGFVTKPGTYRLTDRTYAKLLHKVTRESARPPLGLRQNILAFYSDPNAPIETKRHPKEWQRVQAELTILRNMPAQRIPDAK